MRLGRPVLFVRSGSELRVQPSLVDQRVFIQSDEASVCFDNKDAWRVFAAALTRVGFVFLEMEKEYQEACERAQTEEVKNEGHAEGEGCDSED